MHEASRAFTSLIDHRHYRYRGCAPDPDQPTQAQGAPHMPVDAWIAPTVDGGESKRDRAAREKSAVAVCAACPVTKECRTYGLALDPGGRLLAEPEGIWGGMTSLERHRHLIERRKDDAAFQAEYAAEQRRRAIREASTPQKQAVLVALARETDERMVAWRADMDVRTANWHRASLTGLFGLDRETATRRQLLTAARKLGVLGPIPVRRDGRWRIIAAPNTEGTRQRRLAPGMPVRKAGEVPVQLVVPGYEHLPRTWPAPKPAPVPAATGGCRLRLVAPLAEQLTLPLPAPAPAPVLEPAA
ncbi:WhiB family transcriptional regulator [Streptomyces sp. NPDC017529]|uniref:WhiB family transcriptional regulator n=1 Tax=Streptomyces sp. NPDC017529 TaxID=3365000 RepID=UPI0037AD826D